MTAVPKHAPLLPLSHALPHPPLRPQVSWEAATLGSWFAGLLQRHEQLAKWLTTGRPRAYWMTGFFNPQVGEGGGGWPQQQG